MKEHRMYPRPQSLLLAATLGMLVASCTARAVQTNTTPNATLTSYNLAPGATSAAITLTHDVPIFVMAICKTAGDRGVAHVTMLRHDQVLFWNGMTSSGGGSTVHSNAWLVGTDIAGLNFAGDVMFEVNDGGSVRVFNGNAAQRAGNVRMIW